MEDRNVSPGLFAGVMGLVGASIVKSPTSGFKVMMARVSAELDAFAAFMVNLLIIGLCIEGVGIVLWGIFRIVCWFEELERERTWLREVTRLNYLKLFHESLLDSRISLANPNPPLYCLPLDT